MRDSHFKDVTFRNMYFHYARFENVIFENVEFDWTEDWYMRAEFVNCRFINTKFSKARFWHSFFHRCRFEGGMRHTDDHEYREHRYTFFDFYMYDTVFSHVDWFDTYWHRGEAYNTTFMYNKWTKFEMFETKFHSYYRTKVPCREVKHGDFVYHWEYFDEHRCHAYVYRYAMDKHFDFDDKFYHGVGDDSRWYPSVKFYNCRFERFKFRRTQMRAVEWIYTKFYKGSFDGDNYGYFHDHHFARCHFRDIDFYRFDFRGFAYFTACHFDKFKFYEMTGHRIYFYGSYYYHFYMHFNRSDFMYFDYGHWEHGYFRGHYDFFRFENMVFRYIDWEVDRVDKFEHCRVYYEHFKIAAPNVGEFKSICGDKYNHEKKHRMQFCYDYPHYYQCMHYRPFYRHFYTYDEFTCDTKTFTWWWYWGWYFPKDYDRYHYDKPYHLDRPEHYDGAYYYDRSYFYESSFNYDRPHYDERDDHYRRRDRSYYPRSYDKFYYPTFDFFSLKHCYHKMYECYDQPEVVMRDVDFKEKSSSEERRKFLGMPSTYKFYYDGVYEPKDFWKYYWTMEHAFEKKYYWFERFFRCFK